MLTPTPPFDKKRKGRRRWMRMMTLPQRDRSRTPPPLEPTLRFPKPPITPRSSPQEHPSIRGLSNSQPDRPMGILVNPLRIPRGSGSQTSWEQASPHPTPTKQAVFPYIACRLLQGRDAQGEDSSSHRDPRQPLFPLYPPSQHSLFGALRAIYLGAPLGEGHPNLDTPQSSRASPMLVPAEAAPAIFS